MNKVIKNSIVLFFVLIYCFSVFNFGVHTFDASVTPNKKERVYLAEVTKLIFPQTTVQGEFSVPVITASAAYDFQKLLLKTIFSLMSYDISQVQLNYAQKNNLIALHFPPEDISYRFYDFW